MRELKINPELRDFIPPLSGEEKKTIRGQSTKIWIQGCTYIHME